MTTQDAKQMYPWYNIVRNSEKLEQGDFLDNCQVPDPTYTPITSSGTPLPTGAEKYHMTSKTAVLNVIVISQSCDLEIGKLEYVLVCRRMSRSEYKELFPDSKKFENALEQVRQGKSHRYCMLNYCDLPDLSCEAQIVDFGRTFSLPYSTVQGMAKDHEKRLCLRSPYREKLAQAFGYYYMRIGLPVDIEKFGGKLVPEG